jgi:hypothetical protein
MKKQNLLILCIGLFFLCACKKVEGEGGSSTIKGIITETKYSSAGTALYTFPSPDFDVYIIYGSGSTFYNDDIKTSYDGSFQFNYLQKGDYTVFIYEDCNTCPSGKKEILRSTSITADKSTVDLGTINAKKL